ncbi:hypothetical protein B0H14DRAFT_2729923, partial [Mycena olivaceomarginata]
PQDINKQELPSHARFPLPVTMSAPKHNPFCVIGIYRAPDHSSREEFEKNMAKLMHDIKLLPVAQNNMLKLNVIYQNDKLSFTEMGLPEAPTTVLVTGESETAEHLIESSGFFRDPSIAELIAKAEPFLHGKACAFSADVVTKIDRLQGTRRETCHGIFIFKVPSHMEVGDYHGRVESLVDKLAELPVSQEHMVKYTIWFQNDIVAPELRGTWRFPEAERTVVVMLECDTWVSMNQIFTHEEVKRILGDAMNDFGFHIESNCFPADVDTLVYKYDS